MKLILSICLLLLSCNVYAQKWHLNHIDKEGAFKYEYWFSFDNAEDTSSYNFQKTVGDTVSTIQLTDNKGESIEFVGIGFKNLSDGTISGLLSDFDGLVRVHLKPGRYKAIISHTAYDDFSFDFSIAEKENFNLKVRLGLRPELNIFQINAKTELTESEIITIMQCVKAHKPDFYINCIDKNKYFVSIQI
jgi:hypothetical protein